MNILEQAFWGNTLADWGLALAIAVSVIIVLNILKRLIIRRVRAWVRNTKTDLDDLVIKLFGRTWYLLLIAIAIYTGSFVLKLPEIERALRAVLAILFLIQAAIWGSGLISYLASRQLRERFGEDAPATATINALSFFGRIVLWTVALLLAVDNIPGVEIDALLAGMGIGGIAVALAVQTVLRDLFASLAIHLDQPFVAGDFVTVGEYWGTVLHTGIKSTRIRSITGEELVFSNANLLDSRIRNYKRMEKRRVAFSIGVKCQTPYEKLVQIRQIVQEIIESQTQASFDRVDCKELGASSLRFEIVYYLLSSDYNVYMDVQHAVNLELVRRFEEEGIEWG